MKNTFQISILDWHTFLLGLSKNNSVYVPVKTYDTIDYKLFTEDGLNIIYNVAKPVTPLKAFFLPPKENVVIEKKAYNKNIIIGIPACDLKALEILDEIYLDETWLDLRYKENRERAVLIGTDCFETAENCHCTSYGIEPYPVNHADASSNLHFAEEKRKQVKKELVEKNRLLPDYAKTGSLIKNSGEDLWEKHSRTCVSCGACAVACPTCTCFLLIERPDFEKIRQVDACQYPGFERIAAGEDPLRRKYIRFRNRYLCKYVWKPEDFKSVACTGCGRCIDSCIGKISKNEIFIEMAESS
ncbi:MAG: asrA [Bacteroidetes bacterium]|nr:asrA [Bacteroidota bacterium]